MRRAWLLILVALAAAGILLGPGGNPDAPLPALREGPAGTGGVADPEGGDVAAGRLPSDVGTRPRSLRGTRTDGGLAVDGAGRFVPTIDARRLFDYFLTASGEVPDAELHARVEREIGRRLAPEAARDAVALFERYLAYRERVRALATVEVPDADDLEVRLATLVALRREMLGPRAADAFFTAEEADARRMLEARKIAADDSLSVEERAARVEAVFAAAEADLPPAVRETRATARLATTVREAETEIRARGGDDAEVAAMRARVAGPEAAARLAELDQRRRAWEGRVAAFRAERDRLARDPTLAADGRTAAIAQLLAESFTPPERRRVEALDRIEDGSTATDSPPPSAP